MSDIKPAPMSPETPITRANLAQALLEVIAELPKSPTALGPMPSLCVFDEGAGGPLTFLPAGPKEADHA